MFLINCKGSRPESLVVHGQAKLFGVTGSILPCSMSSLLSDSKVSVPLIYVSSTTSACGLSITS